jgi:parvulin-like peptidyl-prolyl isomerase
LFPEYESVAFGLSVGEVSSPFKTELGYHLVLLEDRVGEKIKTSHILKRVEKGAVDIEKNRENLDLFLSEQDVYNSVETFDSLCAHFSVDKASFQGVFRNTPTSSLPPFLQKISLDSLGFQGPFLEKESLFFVRVFDYKVSEKITLENYYSELFSLTQNQLMGNKIVNLINKEKEALYVEKFY